MTFEEWLGSFDWLADRDRPVIVSADLDGIACGLLQQAQLGWRIIGTYDGAAVCLYVQPDDPQLHEVVFVDMEILRSRVRSIGNHLFALDDEDVAFLQAEFLNCVSPNLWRGINVRATFQQKYPFSTLPLLLAGHTVRNPDFRVERPWLALALHTDSSFTNAAVYQANALEWLACIRSNSENKGLARFCRRLERLSAQQAVALLNEVQTWAHEAGFGGKQRPCRFDLRSEAQRVRVCRLLERLRCETGIAPDTPFANAPTYVEEFETLKLPLHTLGRQKTSFDTARTRRAISMAATGRTILGLQATVPNTTGISIFR
jgi:hypothetical protein